MSLPLEYFKNQTYITDLLKLIDQELFFIIRLFQDELEHFNQFDGFQLKGLIIACNEMKDLIKDIRFILNGYINIINENNLSFYPNLDNERILLHIGKLDIERKLLHIGKIEKYLNKIKKVRILKAKVNDLVDTCLLFIRMLYGLLNEFIQNESQLWNAY